MLCYKLLKSLRNGVVQWVAMFVTCKKNEDVGIKKSPLFEDEPEELFII